MLAREFFTEARVADMRREIIEEGFFADPLVGSRIDSAVFGLNLACAYPFPPKTAQVYEGLAEQLVPLDENAYVYPGWQTHVTIATFINFSQHQSPTPDMVARLNQVTSLVISAMEKLFAPSQLDSITRFTLAIEQPLISRKAAILPMSNPTDEIPRIRRRIAESLSQDEHLRNSLEGLGLNLPPLIHSSIMRFKKVPEQPAVFLSRFNEIASRTNLGTMEIGEILLTTETKPYMREGTAIRRFPLKPEKRSSVAP